MPIPPEYREALKQNAAAIQNGQELPSRLQPIYQGIRAGGIYWDIFLATGYRNYIDAGITAPIAVWMAPARNTRVDGRFWQTVTTNHQIAQTIRYYTVLSIAEPIGGQNYRPVSADDAVRYAEQVGVGGGARAGAKVGGPSGAGQTTTPTAAGAGTMGAQGPQAPDPRKDAISALVNQGIPKKQAAEFVQAAQGTTFDEIYRDAQRMLVAVRQPQQVAPGMQQPAAARAESISEQAPPAGAHAGEVPPTETETPGGPTAAQAIERGQGGTPLGIKDGVWHQLNTGVELPIEDNRYRIGEPGAAARAGEQADYPILALGHGIHRVLAVSPQTDQWYENEPPPAYPRNREMLPAYVMGLRQYLRKMAVNLIERDNWILFWHGYLYTTRQGINFAEVFKRSNYMQRHIEDELKKFDNPVITIVDATYGDVLNNPRWNELKTSHNTGSGYGRGIGGPAQNFYNAFDDVGRELKNDHELRDFFSETYRGEREPELGARGGPFQRGSEAPAISLERRERPKPDLTLDGDLLTALVEAIGLDESLTYNQMLTATASFWHTRLKTVRNVHTTPPGLVMLKDGTVDLQFNFVSRPSTEGRPHRGYVKFIPERGQPRMIDKLKDFLGRIGAQIQRFVGKKVPPQALKGSDLRKMLVEVSCDCKDFMYRMSYANVKAGVTSQAGRTDNGRAPIHTNPARRPGFCKHILATLRYLTDDAEIEISKELSKEQQEALAKDREQFMKEAQEAYEAMKAPEVPEEEIPPLPEEEKEAPPSPAFAKLPEPPKAPPPATNAPPTTPPAPPTPPTPNYPTSQT